MRNTQAIAALSPMSLIYALPDMGQGKNAEH
jgi:hypothetical protein